MSIEKENVNLTQNHRTSFFFAYVFLFSVYFSEK